MSSINTECIDTENEIDIALNKDNSQLYTIIEHFCDALVSFSIYVRKPTLEILDVIKLNKRRTNSFDNYITSIESFNIITHQVVDLLKDIIISINVLFINKTLECVGNFIDLLRLFLVYLLDYNIFDNLNYICKTLDRNKQRDKNVIEKMSQIKYLIFRVCNLTIDITTLFIPKLHVIKEVLIILEKKTDDVLANKMDAVHNGMQIDEIIKQLLDIQLRTQIIASFKADNLLNSLINKKSSHLIRIIENLQTEYVELLNATMNVKMEINIYKDKKKNKFSYMFRKMI
jgi:hypothetical protein